MAYVTVDEFLASPYGAEYQPSGSIFSSSGEIDTFLGYISELIDLYCGRKFDVQTYTDTFEGQSNKVQALKNFPVVSISSIEYSSIGASGTISTNNLLIQSNGILRALSPFEWGKVYTVTYDAGYSTIPETIKQATMMLANVYAQSIDSGSVGQADGGSVTSFRFGKFSETYVDPRQRIVSYAEGIPPTVEAILRRFKYLK